MSYLTRYEIVIESETPAEANGFQAAFLKEALEEAFSQVRVEFDECVEGEFS